MVLGLLWCNKSFSVTTYEHIHAKEFFDVKDNGRISENPSNYLYSGMNSVSIFGNLKKGGEKRIALRQKTFDKYFDKWSKKKKELFKKKTEKFKQQGRDYKESVSRPHSYKKGITTVGRSGSGGKIKYKTSEMVAQKKMKKLLGILVLGLNINIMTY